MIIVTCTGCGETWEASIDCLGFRCGDGEVRPATEEEAARYCDEYDEDPTAGFLYETFWR